MEPITRKEMYLNRLAGEQEQAIPAEPITREEQYLGRLCGENNVIPEKPITRKEIYLANLCGEDITPPAEAITRIEQYMAFASGESESKPAKPITREEMYWDKYQGGDVPEEKTIAFTDIITVTDALARPAVDLQSEITATQNLNGYEYPWVGGAGKNKFNPSEAQNNKWINSDTGEIQNANGFWVTGYIPVKSGEMIRSTAKGSARSCFYNTDKTQFSYVPYAGGTGVGITAPYDGFVVLAVMQSQIEFGGEMTVTIDNEDISYAPYENICPISGRTEVNVTRTGKNLLPIPEWFNVGYSVTYNGITFKILEDGVVEVSGTNNSSQNADFYLSLANQSKNPLYLKNGTYTISISGHSRVYLIVGGNNGNGFPYRYVANGSVTGTVTDDKKPFDYVVLRINSGVEIPSGTKIYIQFELGSTATEYEPYEGDTFNTELGRTVYGGTLDLTTGELTITHAYVDLGDLTWTLFNTNVFRTTLYSKKDGTTNFTTTSYRTVNKTFTELQNGETQSSTLSDHGHPLRLIHIMDERATTPEEFTTLVTGQKMVYELATPQTISLTPTEVMMLENNNTIWADSGRVQLTYLSKAAQRVQSMNASLKANTLKITKAITGGVEA